MDPKNPVYLIDNFKALASIGPGHGIKVRVENIFTVIVEGDFFQRTETVEAGARTQFAASKLNSTIRAVFDTAYEQVEKTPTLFSADAGLPRRAVLGVKHLVTTYRGLSIPGGILGLAELPSDLDRDLDLIDDPPLNLSVKYADYLIVSFEQEKYLPRDNLGVCCALSVDWISRRQQKARNKPSLAVSKKAPLSPTDNAGLLKPLNLPTTLDPERIRRKMDARIAPAQLAYEASTEVSARGALRALGMLDASRKHVAGMGSRHKGIGPRVQVNRNVKGGDREGEMIFREILEHCKPPDPVDPMLPTWKASFEQWQGKPGAEALAEIYYKKIKEAEAKSPHASPGGVRPDALTYVVSFRGSDEGGHALALYLDELRTTIFDPNFGEFEFPRGGESQMYAFFSDLWGAYRNVENPKKRMTNWTLEEFYFNEG